ncbi:MAG: hypothetical protein E3J72_14960 [Planctomycetota bacterium]|nr:MAG: hypothetical protein E3J72_14960 [Planctomycetota bacterium]
MRITFYTLLILMLFPAFGEKADIAAPPAAALAGEKENTDKNGKEPAENPPVMSFWGIDGHPWPKHKDFDYLGKFKEIGVTSYGVEFVNWKLAVPKEKVAVRGPGAYHWGNTDRHIKAIEAHNGIALITLWCISGWATKIPGKEAPPKNEKCWKYWRDFVEALVERYDRDGKDDMPGLKYAHLHYQVQGEAHWKGTVEEYIKLLEQAYKSVKKANKNAKVLYSSFNLGDIFDNNPTVKTVEKMGRESDSFSVKLLRGILKHPELFDIAPTQLNFDYTGIPTRVKWLRSRTDKPIWFVDARAAYNLNHHTTLPKKERNPRYRIDNLPEPVRKVIKKHPKWPKFDEEKIIVKILQHGSKLKGITPDDYRILKKWWEKDKAEFAFKKSVIAAGMGVKHIYSQWTLELSLKPCIPDTAWAACGLLSDGVPGDEMPKGTPRPVYWAFDQFNKKLGNFKSAEIIRPRRSRLEGGKSLYYEIWLIKFTVNGKPIHVVWCDGGRTAADLSLDLPTGIFKTTGIVTELDKNHKPVYPPAKIVPTNAILMDRTPRFIEPTIR